MAKRYALSRLVKRWSRSKLRAHPDFVRTFFLPLRRGGQGGWSRR